MPKAIAIIYNACSEPVRVKQCALYARQNKRTDPQKGALHTITGSMVRFASKSPQIYQCYFLVKKYTGSMVHFASKSPQSYQYYFLGEKVHRQYDRFL